MSTLSSLTYTECHAAMLGCQTQHWDPSLCLISETAIFTSTCKTHLHHSHVGVNHGTAADKTLIKY